MKNLKRTHYCGKLTKSDIEKEVVLSGWVNVMRDHGGLIFVDLRDVSGMVQVVFSPQSEIFKIAETLRSEFVISAKGIVMMRPEGTENLNIPTGEIEVHSTEINILNISKTPVIDITSEDKVDELLRLKYRFLDLRRKKMQQNIIFRHKLTKSIRDFFDKENFFEIETPFLIKSTPEGARDFLVPSRFYHGKFYALPQSPQLFKQLLMVSGFERYFQIVRCFRDEDLRADRQPEFTQVDVEMSFVGADEVIDIMERMLKYVFEKCLNMNLEIPFERIKYDEALEDYGNDKPDIRFELKIKNITDIVKNCSFKVFKDTIDKGGVTRGINAKAAGNYSRKDLDDLTRYVVDLGAKGLSYFIVEDDLKSLITKFFTPEEISKIKELMGAEKGDVLLFVADKFDITNKVLSQLRLHLAKKLNLIDDNVFKFVFIVDFPLFEEDEKEKRLVSGHHPFTSPHDEDIELLDKQPQKAKAKAYDLSLNGQEVAGGSIRIHHPDLQEKIFGILKITPEEAREKFGFLLNALEFGAPPHGGIALGLDRLCAIILKEETIRDVIAFPKTQSGVCPLTDAPYSVSKKQLDELGIKIIDEI